MSAFQVDRLSRRTRGHREVLYLDQSILSELPHRPSLKSIIEHGCEGDWLVCPESFEHRDETVLAQKSFHELADLSDALSLGIEFRYRDEILRNEIFAAAAAFSGKAAQRPVSSEAFKTDPQTPRDELFPGGFRVSMEPDRVDWMEEEAQLDKRFVEPFNDLFEKVRAGAITFDQQAATELDALIQWHLMPLLDPARYQQSLLELWQRMKAELASGAGDLLGAGSAFGRYEGRKRIGDFCDYLAAQYPAVAADPQAFAASEELRHMPFVRYPALFMGALATAPGRKSKRGDVVDMYHLTLGLSRCDIATGDRSMVHLCRSHGLVPSGVRLFSSAELDDLEAHLTALAALKARPTGAPDA